MEGYAEDDANADEIYMGGAQRFREEYEEPRDSADQLAMSATTGARGVGRRNPLEIQRSPERSRRARSEEEVVAPASQIRGVRGPPERSKERSRRQESPETPGGEPEASTGGRGRSGRQLASQENAFPQDADFDDKLVPCSFCGRRFAPDRVATHQAACSKAKASRSPKVFDPSAQRLADFEGDEQKLVHGSGPGRPPTGEFGPSVTKASLRAARARSTSELPDADGAPSRQRTRPSKAVPMFGDVKPNFNPVAEESSVVPARDVKEASGSGASGSGASGSGASGTGAVGAGQSQQDTQAGEKAATEGQAASSPLPEDSRRRADKRPSHRREDSDSSDRDRIRSSRRRHRRKRRDDRSDISDGSDRGERGWREGREERADRGDRGDRGDRSDRGSREDRSERSLRESRVSRESWGGRDSWDGHRSRDGYLDYPQYGPSCPGAPGAPGAPSAPGAPGAPGAMANGRWGYKGLVLGPNVSGLPTTSGMPAYDYARPSVQPMRRAEFPPPQYAAPTGPCSFCVYCGAKFFEGASFCGACGAKRFSFD